MAINRISGNILQDNLQRGSNLAIQGNLIYFDVSNDRVGILTSSPQEDFDVDGNLRVGNVTIFEAGNVDAGNVWVNNLQDPVANSDAATKYYVDNIGSNVNITISDGVNAQQVFNGSTITFLSVANQTDIGVSATDNVTIGLANSVTINQDLTVQGNISGNNLSVNLAVNSDSVTATGNISGNNLLIINSIDTTDITAQGNVAVIGNVTANTITANIAVIDSADIGNLDVVDIDVTGNANISGDVSANNAVIANSITGASLQISGNIVANNITANDTIQAIQGIFSGNVTADYVFANLEAAGANTDIQFNDDGIIAGSSALTFDQSTNALAVLGNISAANASINGEVSANLLSAVSITATGNIVYDGAIIGNLILGNLDLAIQSQGDQDIRLDPGLGLVEIDTSTGLVIPVGNTTQRPGNAVTGTMRYNVDTQRVEIYDGLEWDQVLSDVSAQIITPDGSTAIYVLDRDSTDPATLVAINGVIQLPSVAYSVTGNLITFAEPPLTTDIIDIRFL